MYMFGHLARRLEYKRRFGPGGVNSMANAYRRGRFAYVAVRRPWPYRRRLARRNYPNRGRGTSGIPRRLSAPVGS